MHQDDIKITHRGLSKQRSNGSEDIQKITHAGLVARSPEGTAAKAMNIRGNEDMWVEIQAHTFRNWVNEHLRAENTQVNNWATDFCDGTKLCMLVEVLQNSPLKMSWKRRPLNQHHFLENVTAALSAIEADHIKLVNIGNVDIVNGNVKLILGLIWSLIVRYQIGRSKFPPRKLMLAWLQAVLPDCKITNLTTDWNSGINLAALCDYCEPGLFSHWRSLDPDRAVSNCTHAMNVAQKEFGVPKVLEPEYLASPWLDELSGMTYLSYFMKPGGPGYNATMRWVNSQLEDRVKNFTTDWNDGRVFHEIIKNKGANVGKFSHEPANFESNIRNAVEAGYKLGVEPILSPKEMANSDVEHLGIMAYAARLQNAKPRPSLASFINIYMESTSGRVGEPVHFRVELLSQEIDLNQVKAYVEPPTGRPIPVRIDSLGDGVFIPENYGMHEITLTIEDETIGGHYFRVLPRLLQVVPPNMAPCALGSVVEVLVNATGAPKTEDISVVATSPTGIDHNCPLRKIDEGHSAKFKPNEAGIWTVAIMYQGRHIQNGPFTCSVFDLSGVTVHGLDGAVANRAHSFDIDARGVGVSGELHVDIVHEKKSLACAVDRIKENEYRVTFLPHKNGKYRVYVYFNSFDVKGSPYILRIGKKSRSGKTQPHSTLTKNKNATSHQIYSSSKDNHSKDYDEKIYTHNSYGSQNKMKDLEDKMNSHNIYGTHKSKDLDEKTYTTGNYGSYNKSKDSEEKTYTTGNYGSYNNSKDSEEKTYTTGNYGAHHKSKDLDEKTYTTGNYKSYNKPKDLDEKTYGTHHISKDTEEKIYTTGNYGSYNKSKDLDEKTYTTGNYKSYNKPKDLDEKTYATGNYETHHSEEKTYTSGNYGSFNKSKDFEEKVYTTGNHGIQHKSKDLDDKTYMHSTYGTHFLTGSPSAFDRGSDDVYEEKHHSSYSREKKEEYTTDSSPRLGNPPSLTKRSYFDGPKNNSSNIIISSSSKTRVSPLHTTSHTEGWDSIERKNHHFTTESRDTIERKNHQISSESRDTIERKNHHITADHIPKHLLDRKQYMEFQKDMSYSEVRYVLKIYDHFKCPLFSKVVDNN